tara:strand:+ start:13205 stop:14515 length:1311 start_codon:yes stop_codon:yes gene_type:complete
LIHAGPGAGKTLGALASFKTLKNEGRVSKCLIFCHRKSILSQWSQASKDLGLQIGQIFNNDLEKVDFRNIDGYVISYQGAAKRANDIRRIIEELHLEDLMVIADEAHHLGLDPEEPDAQIWGQSFSQITSGCLIRVGLTGTPFRADNLAFCSAKRIKFKHNGINTEQITPDLCIEPIDLISQGDVRPLEFHFQDGFIDHKYENKTEVEKSFLSQEIRESWRARNLRRAIKVSDSSSIAMHLLLRAKKKLDQVRNFHGNAAGLVIAKDISHAISIRNILQENGDSVEIVHSQNRDSSTQLENFEFKQSKWLVSVDMCSEGFNAPRLRVVAYLTTVATKNRFLQGITRTVRMSKQRELIETIPRSPSYVFAPADPLLMEYARSWSISEPYLIKKDESPSGFNLSMGSIPGPSLPKEAVGDKAGKLIKINSPELPNFIK